MMVIRRLEYDDLEKRVEWLNDERVNSTLNIALPVSLESTKAWFERNIDNDKRIDFSFEEDGVIVAMGGYTDIDKEKGEAELYIFVDPGQKGKGIGFRSVRLMCDYAFDTMGLNKIILYANGDNAAARHLYEKIGFVLESVVEGGIENHGVAKDQYYYGLTRN
ncbi:MAG: GNAT family protein [Paludibacteraceae bacterium]|jgi:diamine N-acetyltransferase|nr:GNAT family protein [Paludibacteraceae bacterium]